MTREAGTDLSELPHWDDQPDLWDACYLAGKQLPGLIIVDIDRGRKIDVKSPKGRNQATVTVQGNEPANVTITVEISTREDLLSLNEILPLLEPVTDPKKATASDAIDIACPMAAIRGVSSIIVSKLAGPKLKNGLMTLTLTAIEFDAPPAAKGLGGKGGAGTGGALKYDVIGTFADSQGNLFGSSTIYARLVSGSLSDGVFEEKPGPGSHGTFAGKFLIEDLPAKEAAEANAGGHVTPRDVTATIDSSQDGSSRLDFEKGDTATDPATVDPAP
jgi:hypothetical protein